VPEYADVRVEVRRDSVEFELGDDRFIGKPDFRTATFRELTTLRNEETPDKYGARLKDLTFRQDAKEGLDRLVTEVNRGGAYQLRLQIHPSAPELHSLRWECLLYEEQKRVQRRFGTGQWTPLSRYIALTSSRAVAPADVVKVLVVISNADRLGQGPWARYEALHETTERGVLEDAFRGLDRIQPEFMEHPASLVEIRARLQDGGHHILHIVGHGYRSDDDRGRLLLEKRHPEAGTDVDAVDQARLAEMVKDLQDLQLVVLAACHSAARSDADTFLGLAPEMVLARVPAVIAMQEKVEQAAAREFAARFYQWLAGPHPDAGRVDVAVNIARERLQLGADESSWQWSVPVLFLRGEGRLFATRAAREPKTALGPHVRSGPAPAAPSRGGEPVTPLRPVLLHLPEQPPPSAALDQPGKRLSPAAAARARGLRQQCKDLLDDAEVNPDVLPYLIATFELDAQVPLDAETLAAHVVRVRLEEVLREIWDRYHGRQGYGGAATREAWG
jgi:hypothetical protein